MDLHIGIVENQFAGGLVLVLPGNHAHLAGDQRQLVGAGDGELAYGVDGVVGADGAGAVLHHVNDFGGEVDAGRICAVEIHVKYRVGDGGRNIGIHIDTKLAFVCHQLTAGDVERSFRTDHAGMTGIAAGGVVGHADGEVFHRQFCIGHGYNTHTGGSIVIVRIIHTGGLGLDDDGVLIRAVVGAADGRVSDDRNTVVGFGFAEIDAVFDFAGQQIEGQRTVDLHGQS